jgi:PAS domain S-box-containing protein
MNVATAEAPPAKGLHPFGGHTSGSTGYGIRKIERREWWLWACAVVISLLLTLGIASLGSPGATLSFRAFEEMSVAVRGLVGMVFLFDIYVIYQQYQIRSIRRRLNERDELFRMITETAADMIAVVDTKGRRVYNSPSYERILGYSAEQLGETSAFEQIHPEDRGKVNEAANEATRNGVGRRVEYRMRHRDGSWRYLESTASTVPTEDGTVDKLVIVNRDITDRKRAEEALEQYKNHLEELVATRTAELARKVEELACSNRDLEQFAYVASHDLQEPLRMVASYTQLLAQRYRGKLDSDADEFIGFAVDGASRMQQLIEDLLSYSRLTTRGKALAWTQSETACNAAVKNLQEAIKDSRAVVRVGPLPKLFGDPSQLTLLFQNLIGNAIKYRNQRTPEIDIDARLQGEEWLFSVRDNGIGIEPQYLERIFQMFQRLHSRKDYPGTGIGLAACKKIVERHGGRIWVESQPGEGSTFRFTIPQAEGSK